MAALGYWIWNVGDSPGYFTGFRITIRLHVVCVCRRGR